MCSCPFFPRMTPGKVLDDQNIKNLPPKKNRFSFNFENPRNLFNTICEHFLFLFCNVLKENVHNWNRRWAQNRKKYLTYLNVKIVKNQHEVKRCLKSYFACGNFFLCPQRISAQSVQPFGRLYATCNTYKRISCFIIFLVWILQFLFIKAILFIVENV